MANISKDRFNKKLDVEFKESGLQSDIFSENGLILNFSQRKAEILQI